MTTRDSFGLQYPYIGDGGWEHLGRNVQVRNDAGVMEQVRVHATAPCQGCVTKMHLDLRLRCICSEDKEDRCVQADLDKDACLSIPPVLGGAAQIISRFGAALLPDAEHLLLAARQAANDNGGQLPAGDLPFPRPALLRFCRKIVVLEEAELALRACISEEHRALLSKRETEHRAVLRAEAVSNRRLLALQLEMQQRLIEGHPMPRVEFARLMQLALPEYELNSA
ncbi:hypothetical protein GGR50DRAFT_699086, partial [Xylaria sp. CBS 124048]